MLQNDLDYMVSDLPCVVTWDGQTVAGTRTEVTKQDDVEDDGIYNRADLQLVVSTDQWSASPPANRQVIGVDGVNYFIQTQEPSQDGIATTFSLERI